MNRKPRVVVWGAGLAGTFAVVLAGWLVLRAFPRASPRELLRNARRALSMREFARAEAIALSIPRGAPERAPALLIAGEAATRQQHFEQAVAHYREIADDARDEAATAASCMGDLLFELGEAREAETEYRRALALRPGDLATHQQLSSLLATFGRRFEAVGHLFELVRGQRATTHQLLLLADPEAVVELTPLLSKFRNRSPQDPLPFVAEARSAFDTHDPDAAAVIARQAINADPAQIEAWAILGKSLVDRRHDEAAFREWETRVPKAAEAHPDVWVARGLWAEEHDEPHVAIRCFWEAIRRFPDARIANYHLAQTLLKAEPSQGEAATAFLNRAERLEELRNITLMVFRKSDSALHMQKAAELTESLGRLWEAAAWCQAALAVEPGTGELERRLQRLARRLDATTPRVVPESDPSTRFDFSSYPLPKWSPERPKLPSHAAARSPAAGVSFDDRAAAAGIEFRYFSGAANPGEGKLIYQNLGGGVAALDYDGDLWPDLYFAQGAPRPNDFEEHGYRDYLYRNRGDGRFDDVTLAAGLGDLRHTLGLAAGDIDNDGFPDLYLANAGSNRLYRNNGDGTFADITVAAGISGRFCTASCLIADLNGDSWPDLFDVNYLAEPKVYELTCEKDGKVRSCDPALFTAEYDRMFLSLGDGRYEEVSNECGIRVPNGKGLGIVALDLRGNGFLDLFIANDGTGNFLFTNQTGERGGRPAFEEEALAAGVALSEDGRVQASMGVAVDDADGDGLLDLFVTNFYEESSAFYRQTAVGIFEDARRRFGLREPSLFQLGFGTQFIDGDLDGFPDLVVTNGHIDDYRDTGRPFRMKPQYFRNVGGTRFEELKADALGPFFAGEYLGRGLARLDWNRDGREDVVISHLDAPAALLTNTTARAGHFLALSLVATETARDAVGTSVRCTAAGRTRSRQLTAGDGYMASNERRLVFGLGDVGEVDALSIRWPSGREQTFHRVAADGHWLAIENRQALVRLPVPAAAKKN